MVSFIIFTVVSAGIIWLSWPSLRDPRSHGFYRFFAFESLLGLILLNVDAWFIDPFALRQIASWVLLLVGTILAVHGFYLLHAVGQPQSGIENTTKLVQTGAYRYIRHPLYHSLLLGLWGVFLKDISMSALTLALVATGFLIATAKVEEQEMLQKFGDDYRTCMTTTKMLIPHLF